MKHNRKEQAIKFRREGKTYSEIRAAIPVAKSTLSIWFKEVKLAEPQKQRITKLRKAAQMRGAHARRNKRLLEIKTLNKKGIQEIGKLTRRELWLIGIALHWAEGSKQRESSLSTGVIFTNSDPHMLSLFLNWLKVLGVEKRDIFFELYVHDSRTQEIPASKIWWSKKLRITPSDFGAVYMKRDKIMTNRKNITDLYHGLIRIKVRSSTSLNRQINGWIEGIVQQ